MNFDVVIVEDNKTAAADYVNLVRKKTGLGVVYVSTAAETLELVQKHQIKVLILDQKLGVEAGTAVFAAVKALDSRIKAVMFTGQAEKDDVASALKSGYSDYLDKASVAELPAMVLKWYHAYQLEAAQEDFGDSPTAVLRRRVWRFPWSHAVTYTFSNFDVLDPGFIDDQSWQTVLELNAGEQREFTHTTTSRSTLQFEEESTLKLKSGLGMKSQEIVALTSSLESELSNRFKNTASKEHEESRADKRLHALPPEPVNPNELHVVKRRLEEAQEWRRLKLYVRAECSCCLNSSFLALPVSQATGRIASRIVNILSDGSTTVIPAGTSR